MRQYDVLLAIVVAALFMTLLSLGTIWDKAQTFFEAPSGCILYDQGVCM